MSPLVVPAFYLLLLPALVWGSMAVVAWRIVLTRMSGQAVMWLLAVLLTLVALYFTLESLLAIVPGRPGGGVHPLAMVRDACLVFAVAATWHVIPLSPARGRAPRPTWIAAGYAAAGLVALLAALPGLVPAPTPDERWLASRAIVVLYLAVMPALGIRELRRLARQGAWGPGGLGEVRQPDVVWGIGSRRA